jgi:hypothetical protein
MSNRLYSWYRRIGSLQFRCSASSHYMSFLLLLALTTGCSQLRSLPLRLSNQRFDAKFSIQVNEATTPGRYDVMGTTSLPDQSRLAVAAVRYLHPVTPLSRKLTSEATYAILAYREVTVTEGKWQVKLNLWRVAPDGHFREVWQFDPSRLNLSVIPDTEVVFIAVPAPLETFPDLEQSLARKKIQIPREMIHTTLEGERYMQASQRLAVSLPTEKISSPPILPQDVNGGWGNRFLILPEPPNPIQLEASGDRKTNAPSSPDEFLQ